MAPTKQDLEALATSFRTAYATLSAPAHLALRAPHCTHIYGPSSINPPAPKTNAEDAAHITQNLGSVLAGCPITARETYINAGGLEGGKSQIIMWANAYPEFKKEAMRPGDKKEEWEWVGEYFIVLNVDEEGKIERILEFVDSKRQAELGALVARARENLGLGSKPW